MSSFETYKIKTKYKDKTKEELQEELNTLESDLDSLTAGDKKVVEKEIQHIKYALQVIEDTVAGDIAGVERNLFAKCDGTPKCQCGKCQMLRRKDLQESVQLSPFSSFFSKQ